jgi:hypothetical protein
VVWLDRSWFGKSPVIVHNFYNCSFNLKLILEVLSHLAPKAVEFAEIFQKLARSALTVFQIGKRFATGFSKENCSSETYFVDLKADEIGLGWFPKALIGALRNLFSNDR